MVAKRLHVVALSSGMAVLSAWFSALSSSLTLTKVQSELEARNSLEGGVQ